MINVAIAVILAISAFIIPAAVIYPAKSSFITTQAEEIGTSAMALVTGGVGILAFAAIFFVFGVVENRLKKSVLAFFLAIIAFLGISFSIKDYYYITPTHFAMNEPFSYETILYEWEDFESVEEVITKIDGTTAVEKVILHMKNDKQYTFDGGSMMRMYATIISRMESAGGEHIRTKY